VTSTQSAPGVVVEQIGGIRDRRVLGAHDGGARSHGVGQHAAIVENSRAAAVAGPAAPSERLQVVIFGAVPPADPDDPFDDRVDGWGDGWDDGGSRPEGERGWRHPSEIAMQARQQEDRARPRRIAALAFLALGGAIVAIGVALGWGWVPSGQDETAGGGADPTAVVSLTLVSDAGTTTRTGVVVGRDDRIVTRSAGLDPETQVWVAVSGREPMLARLAGEDPETGLSVLEVDSPVGRTCELADEPDVGDELVVWSAAVAERRPERRATSVEATDVDELQVDGTLRRGLFLASDATGPTTPTLAAAATDERAAEGADGVVYDDSGRLVGVVVSRRTGTGHLVVSSATDLVAAVDRLDAATPGAVAPVTSTLVASTGG